MKNVGANGHAEEDWLRAEAKDIRHQPAQARFYLADIECLEPLKCPNFEEVCNEHECR